MRFESVTICFQEVPNEISLGLVITGCKLACPGCHSNHTWNQHKGQELTCASLEEMLAKYTGLITCVVFFGGEWEEENLISLLQVVKNKKLKTALYTGQDNVSPDLQANLTFLKTGKWDRALGGLSSRTTNQKFINVSTNEVLNHLFTEE